MSPNIRRNGSIPQMIRPIFESLHKSAQAFDCDRENFSYQTYWSGETELHSLEEPRELLIRVDGVVSQVEFATNSVCKAVEYLRVKRAMRRTGQRPDESNEAYSHRESLWPTRAFGTEYVKRTKSLN